MLIDQPDDFCMISAAECFNHVLRHTFALFLPREIFYPSVNMMITEMERYIRQRIRFAGGLRYDIRLPHGQLCLTHLHSFLSRTFHGVAKYTLMNRFLLKKRPHSVM